MDRREQEIQDALSDYVSGRLSRRGFLQRAGLVGVGAVAAGTLLSACSDDSSSGGSESTSSGSSADPVKGGTFREGYDRDFTPPDSINNAWADPSFYALFETVITRDPDGNFVPMLASAFDSGSTGWTFDIPSGLTFQSGDPLGSKQVAEFFNVARDPNQGANAIFWGPITAVEAQGSKVVCKTDGPFQAFQETVCTEYSMIENVKARKAAGDTWGSKTLDSCGPFTLGEFIPGRSVTVNRWADYPGTNAPFITNKGPAYLDAIEWVPITEASQRAAEIETGNVDALKNPPPQDIDSLKSNGDLVVQEFQELSNFYLQLNMGNSGLGFDDVHVRQAVSAAIDRETIVQSIFLGHAVPTYGPVPPGNRWYDSGVEEFNQFDQDKSNSLLDDAGWAKGSDGVRAKNGTRLSFSIMNLTDTTENQVLQALTQMLAEVGVEVKIDSKSTAAFWPALSDKTPSYAFKWLWSAPIEVIEYFMDFYQPKSARPPEMAQLYTDYQAAGSDDEMMTAAGAYQKWYAENLPLIPIYTPNTIWVNHKNVVGWQPNQANIYPYYNDVWLAQ
jgi:peptide/nickel transport system substrate-binding protein